MESRRAKEEAEQEKAEMLAVAAAKAKEEAANLLAKAGQGHLADQHSLRRARNRSNPRQAIRNARSDNDEGTSSTTKTHVVAESDLSDLFRAVGMTRRVPKGVWTEEKLTDAILTHADLIEKVNSATRQPTVGQRRSRGLWGLNTPFRSHTRVP